MARFAGVAHTERGLDRLINFSDAVIAIAATLLILPIVETMNDAFSDSTDLADFFERSAFWLQFGSLVAGFIWMTVFWRSHHEIFERVKDYSSGLIALNFLWLIAMVFFAVPVGLLYSAESLYSNGIAALYLANIGLISFLLIVTRIYVIQRPQLLIDPAQKLGRKYVISVFISPAILFLGAFAALFVGQLAFFVFLPLVPIHLFIRRYKPPPPPHTERGMDRVVNFSDAVVAIAITLLILPLVDVITDLSSSQSQQVSLTPLIAKTITFAFTFWLMSRQWLINHRLFENVKDYSQRLIHLTLLWLLLMVLIAIPSNFMGQVLAANLDRSTQQVEVLGLIYPQASLLLGLVFALIALVTGLIIRYLQHHPEFLVDPSQSLSPRASYYTAILYFGVGAAPIPLYANGYGMVASLSWLGV
ncbi:MAG: DUF1211 domain-containing protein, partial [Proteobacteria bacterium]|nr:DUF1211 domain-containing protein [Pseudomonadota bacterium]